MALVTVLLTQVYGPQNVIVPLAAPAPTPTAPPMPPHPPTSNSPCNKPIAEHDNDGPPPPAPACRACVPPHPAHAFHTQAHPTHLLIAAIVKHLRHLCALPRAAHALTHLRARSAPSTPCEDGDGGGDGGSEARTPKVMSFPTLDKGLETVLLSKHSACPAPISLSPHPEDETDHDMCWTSTSAYAVHLCCHCRLLRCRLHLRCYRLCLRCRIRRLRSGQVPLPTHEEPADTQRRAHKDSAGVALRARCTSRGGEHGAARGRRKVTWTV
ncbi:hypothetical protein DFH07DRAFT_950014 [Mycena maculata]|uniref:Uncharacterized protein n=1 Tax=Mycena maculata TaxID=230809 RepID=A0AAD7K8W4_9AGAR|nr:hypothetical protein DFH07DRAFT_950014 [Mycena maculata]